MNRSSYVILISLLLTSAFPGTGKAEPLKPTVEINRSALEDLKGYSPPDMFGNQPAPQNPAEIKIEGKTKPVPATSIISPKIEDAAAPTPTLTMPTAEQLLSAPIENSIVTTEEAFPLPANATSKEVRDAATAKLDEKPVKNKNAPPLPGHKPKEKMAEIKAAKKSERLTVEPIIEKTVSKVNADFTKKKREEKLEKSPLLHEIPETGTYVPYKPKQGATMPAMPTGKVDAFSLPLDEPSEKAQKPTSFDNAVDQAFQSKMVDVDGEALTNSLNKTSPDRKTTHPLQASALTDITSAMPKAPEKKVEKSEIKKEDKKEEQASLSSPAKSSPDKIVMNFKEGLSELDEEQKSLIDNDLLAILTADQATRVQIVAYAEATADGQSSARRVSLSRALSIRAYLLEKGLEAQRMDIRAMGNNTAETPVDRVDLIISGKT